MTDDLRRASAGLAVSLCRLAGEDPYERLDGSESGETGWSHRWHLHWDRAMAILAEREGLPPPPPPPENPYQYQPLVNWTEWLARYEK